MKRFDMLSPAARALWAKSGEPHGHGLLPHMLDVAAVARRLLEREPPATLQRVAQALHLPSEACKSVVAALAGLHDIGKGTPGFQNKWEAGRATDEAAGLSFPRHLLSADAHDLASGGELRRLLQPYFGREASALAGAVAAHHGYVFLPKELKEACPAGEPPAWSAARQELFDAYGQLLFPKALECDAELQLADLSWLAGLTSVADWIGSNVEWFPLGERADTLAGHYEQALCLAERALDAIRWPHYSPLLKETATTDEIVSRIVGRPGLTARPLQQAADRLLQGVAAPALLLVEAPMGEGKTELAFLAHLRLQAALGHRGLYMGLPTQATGNAMFNRALTFLRAFGPDLKLDLQLAHGGALLDERLVELRDIHGKKGDNVGSSTWFSQRRRPLLSPYGVGTIDQALFATINVKHHFVRLWGLSNRVVVLDEVHAYDTYTGGLIEALLRWLKALGCSVILMSATLPRAKRDGLLQAWDTDPAAAPDLAYPRALLAQGGEITGEHFDCRPLAPIELQGLDEDLESIAQHAATLLSHGGCGAIIVNTVDRAQRLFTRLQALLPDAADALMLFHAQYPADERSQREQAVLGCFGREAQRPQRKLLIATQVVEQSLDIDFDFLISDLAPVDLLLQRAGRLHRHERERPAAHAQPVLIVAGLLPLKLPDLEKTGWGWVYEPYVLGRTWAFASRENRWQLPQDIDRLVQTVYGNAELPPGLDAQALKSIDETWLGDHMGEEQAEELFAHNAAIDAHAEPQYAYANKTRGDEEGNGLGINAKTRLGEESITVVPVHVDGEQWRVRPDGEPFDPELKPDHALARQLLARQLRISRKGVVAHFKDAEVPKGFEDHPWLRDVKPLRLQAGMLAIGKQQIRLDPVLGMVYRSADDKKPEEAS
jgi:CRISPR-associated endonuclease/helicase Cas3